MFSISDFQKEYHKKIYSLDLDLLISAAINKPREFVLTHPECVLAKNYELRIKNYVKRRAKHEPLAYILGQKEFYGLEFKVDKNTLIPRPEAEQLVELALKELQTTNHKLQTFIIDVGTGSGNIIISIAKAIYKFKTQSLKFKFIGVDISRKALQIAKQNAKFHKVSKKINFLQGNLLEPIIKTTNHQPQTTNYIIVANLPYLSYKIYNSTPKDVKNYEPKSALLSNDDGLAHYQKLLQQLKKLRTTNHQLQTFIEFSPEQKVPLKKAILAAFPQSHPIFFKDLAGKFRVAQIKL